MRKIVAAALLASPLFAMASGNLVTNGGFEATPQADQSWSIYAPGIAGWSTDANLGIEVRNNVVGSALEGVRFVELDTTGNSWISQSIDTVAGQWYQLSFDYSNRIGVDVASNGLAWSFGSAAGSAAAQAYNGSGNNDWHAFSTLVQATGSSMLLKFSATGASDSLGTSLDNISVTAAVPEPETYALMLAGLAAIGTMARRRQRK